MKIKHFLKLASLFVLILVLFLPEFFIFGETDPAKERKILEEELKKLEEQIAQYEKEITKTEKEKKTLQNKIYTLRKKIKKLDLQIYHSNLIIKDLTAQIKDTENSIEKTSFKIKNFRDRLATILQRIYEKEQLSLIEILLSEAELSDFFDHLMALEILNSKNQKLLENIKSLKISLENQKQLLSQEKEDTERMLEIQSLQKREQEKIKKEQEYFLKLTEAEYQKYLKEKADIEKRAAEIRARIFELIGIPKAPTFGEALELAKYVEDITGIRPAFLLAVLTQESNIGKNVGQCYLKDPKAGSGIVISTGKKISRVMKPTRDVQPFLEITKELGRDPYYTPVSCPMSFGWGGAMGPAQFIPSTWKLYKDKVKAITGRPADPWNIKDAFLAAALLLRDAGAGRRTYQAEWEAAMIYFSGTVNKRYRFYGDSVMAIAKQYEKDIREIERAG